VTGNVTEFGQIWSCFMVSREQSFR
jgi:hypothetical protein